MSGVDGIAALVVRQALSSMGATSTAAAAAATTTLSGPPACVETNDFDGRIGLRISAIFVILFGSLLGAVFPVYASRHRGTGVPEWAFFIAKYFGSGVIIATAFIHLLSPANQALTNPCLTGPITDYDWVEGIVLMTIFVLFFVELMAMRYATFGHADHPTGDGHDVVPKGVGPSTEIQIPSVHTPGEDHLSHTRTHIDDKDTTSSSKENGSSSKDGNHRSSKANDSTHPIRSLNSDRVSNEERGKHQHEEYAAQMTAIFILEFGVIFHSIFVGLTLAVAGSEFTTLYVVLVFHQTFEGLGLGSRLAATPWPASKRIVPYFFGVGYALSTPLAMAVGLGVRNSYAPGSQTSLIVNGVFDSISAGILIYTGLVELMAHEFMFSTVMRRAKLKVVMSAFGMMCLGAGLMALLGKWA